MMTMRRWPMSEAPHDGTVIVACTRVEGVEHRVRWAPGEDGHWIDQTNGRTLPAGLFVAWRRCER